LCEPAGGRITVGGVDLAGCDPASWRAQVDWAPQDPTLFRGTVADNIRLGDPDATDERVREAARLAGADSFVAALPQGYRTPLGEGGRQLSAGERQRIGLARAFLRDAPLLILDEPTANLDPASAERVDESIDQVRGTRTVLVISHRAELAFRADRVLELHRGRLRAPEPVPA
jgi:ABC-type multidrug transport system fused ATPase/permease subunit